MLKSIGLVLLTLSSVSSAGLFYDASLGTAPSAQGLTYQQLPIAGGPFFSTGATSTTFNSTASPIYYVGFHNYQADLSAALDPTLNWDRNQGFSFSFDNVKINSETHGSNERAGFSWIVLANDHIGIELSFWTDRIWAQDADFTHAEETNLFNPSLEHDYDLDILGNSYELFADAQPILSGSLRDYVTGPQAVYGQENFLFIGDDTSSASSSVTFGSLASVPEPASVGMIILGTTALLARRRRLAGLVG